MFEPHKGNSGPPASVVSTRKRPSCKRRVTIIAVSVLLVLTDAANPYSVSMAMAMASSTVSKGMIVVDTGPKTSTRANTMLLVTFPKSVGAI